MSSETASVNGTTGMGTSAARGPRPERRPDGFLHRTLDVGEVRLHVAEARPHGIGAGDEVPKDVPLVVFLHGFPEFWWSWHRQLRGVADGGFWAVAPDLRGYNESNKPEGVGAYEVEKLAGDVAGLVRALGRDRAIVVGHDWGAVVAWTFAQLYPSMLVRLAILNVPHPLAMMRGLRRPAQMKKSWYMFFFQLPRLPEKMLAKDDYAFLRRTFAGDGFSREEIEPYVDAMRVPGAATSAINYYRAALRRVAKGTVPKTQVIDRPVLVIWGDRDRFLGVELAEPPARFVPHARVVHIPGATHWVQHDAAEQVNELLLGFAQEERGAAFPD